MPIEKMSLKEIKELKQQGRIPLPDKEAPEKGMPDGFWDDVKKRVWNDQH